mmetsp:Transcript_22884/g.58119  ORF Transcript_22884/g.58119 Transcript_22884/m.58119 type:complete len:200 (-) Transcript_22884:451-1050(-)
MVGSLEATGKKSLGQTAKMRRMQMCRRVTRRRRWRWVQMRRTGRRSASSCLRTCIWATAFLKSKKSWQTGSGGARWNICLNGRVMATRITRGSPKRTSKKACATPMRPLRAKWARAVVQRQWLLRRLLRSNCGKRRLPRPRDSASLTRSQTQPPRPKQLPRRKQSRYHPSPRPQPPSPNQRPRQKPSRLSTLRSWLRRR